MCCHGGFQCIMQSSIFFFSKSRHILLDEGQKARRHVKELQVRILQQCLFYKKKETKSFVWFKGTASCVGGLSCRSTNVDHGGFGRFGFLRWN